MQWDMDNIKVYYDFST